MPTLPIHLECKIVYTPKLISSKAYKVSVKMELKFSRLATVKFLTPNIAQFTNIDIGIS